MHINHYDLSMAMNDVSDVNRKVERLEKRVETLERILAAHPERTAKATEKYMCAIVQTAKHRLILLRVKKMRSISGINEQSQSGRMASGKQCLGK